VTRSLAPSQEKKGWLNQLSVTAKSVLRILFALFISKAAIFSIIVSMNRNKNTEKGRAGPELIAMITKQKSRIETGKVIREYKISRSLWPRAFSSFFMNQALLFLKGKCRVLAGVSYVELVISHFSGQHLRGISASGCPICIQF
jgi:hypothetical protein